MGNPPNPNGANQYQLDPRQRMCWDLYVSPKSATFGNAKASAIKAGYEVDYADQITTSEWFIGKLRRLNMLSKSEKVLDEMLEMPVEQVKQIGEVSVTVVDAGLVKIKQDTAKFLAERLGKDDGYSTRSELTGKDGDALIPDKQSKEKADEALDIYLNGQDKGNIESGEPEGTTVAV